MDSRKLRPGSLPSTVTCFPPQHYAPPSRHFSSCPPLQFVSGLPPFPCPQGNFQFPPVGHHNRAPSQYFARLHPQHFVPSLQCPPREVHINHHPPPQSHSVSPPRHFASTPTQQWASPKVQRGHHYPPQHPNPPSKRQKRAELQEPDDQQEQDDSNHKKPAAWAVEAQNYVYRPEANEDPFKHSRSLRHQQPANPRKRNDEDFSDKSPDDAQDEEDDSDLGEELALAEREEIAYKKLLPKVKQLVSELDVNEKWPHDREEKMCMVCNFPMRCKGWRALVQHAESFQKRKPVQHRAYFRVLTELLKERFNVAEGKAVLIENGKATEEVIVWPPVVIIDNMRDEECMEKCVPNLKPLDVQRTFRFSKRGLPGLGRMLVVFPASEVGHLNSKLLVDSLAMLVAPVVNSGLHKSPRDQLSPFPPPPPQGPQLQCFGPGRNRQVEMPRDCPPPSYVNGQPCDQQGQPRLMAHQQQQPLRVFLAQAADMQLMDPQRKLVKWSIENKREILKCVLKKSKEEHELEKAKVKAKLVEVDHIAESHQQFKSRKAVLSQELKDAEMALKLQKDREDQIAKQHAEQLQIMDKKFKEEVRGLEFERINREVRIRQLLEENEKQLEKERVEKSKEVEFLVKYLEIVNQEFQDQSTRKALEKERQIARKREEIYNEIKRREAKFNEEGRNLERKLLEEQESEKKKFLEEYNKIRQEFLDEWVVKQAALKQKAERAKQEKENLMKLAESKKEAANECLQGAAECSICFEEFDDNTKRALINPCGHAQTCVPCAVDIFSNSMLCPICRVKMSSKPKAIPYKLFM